MNYRQKMEEKLGRKLLPKEIIHKDLDGTNDEISNLEIVTRKSHAKIHSQIKVDYDKKVSEILEQTKVTDLSECLDVFFTARQKHLIYKKFLKQPMSKTEQEYFCRTCKKKLKAIAHPTLFSVCQQMAWQML